MEAGVKSYSRFPLIGPTRTVFTVRCLAFPLVELVASTVGMPVARHPPYSPGRAVFPHPVLRLYSLPRCKAEPSSKHSPTWNLRNTRTRYLDAVEDVGKLLPRVTPLLASPPVEPFERTVHRPMEKAVQRAGVPAHAIVVVVAP